MDDPKKLNEVEQEDMVEGYVTKLKLIKRQMYGKAGLALLRQRILHGI